MKKFKLLSLILLSTFLLGACTPPLEPDFPEIPSETITLSNIPDYSGEPYVVLNDNIPNFTNEDLTTKSYESYSELDNLGRCGVAFACIGTDLMPTKDRENISHMKPSGWQSAKYEQVDGQYLYNRCHLIGFQLSGENANKNNLITGTRYLNVEGMLPFENMVADYVKETDNHVLYRVTPIFASDCLVASGVQMEALSVEDNGEGISFHIYAYNVQPGIEIDYATGDSRLAVGTNDNVTGTKQTYILNTNNKKFHKTDCSSVTHIKDSNKKNYTGSREDIISQGYTPCGHCNP